jgi:hypothetical protein
VSRRTEHSAKTARTSHRVPDTQILSGPSAEREQTPRLGGPETPRVRRRRYAHGCQASSERLAHLPYSMREMLSALYHSRDRGDFCQAVLLVARYQGAQSTRWRHSHNARQSATPDRHDDSAMEYHNAYAVDPIVYAATYTTCRVAGKRFSITVASLVSIQYSIHPCWAHLSWSNAYVHVLLAL